MASTQQKELENVSTQVQQLQTLAGRLAAGADDAGGVRMMATEVKAAADSARKSVDALTKELIPPATEASTGRTRAGRPGAEVPLGGEGPLGPGAVGGKKPE